MAALRRAPLGHLLKSLPGGIRFPGYRLPQTMTDSRRPAPQPRSLRLLHVVLDLEAGGLERLVADLILRLDPKRFESHLLVLLAPGRLARELEGHAEVHQARPSGPGTMVWPRALTRQIRAIAPDVVHTHSGVWYKASLAARRAGVPRLIHTDHGRQHPDPWRDRFLDRLASRRTDVVVAVSEALAHQLRDSVAVDPAKLRVILNGVDTDRFRPRDDAGGLRPELALGPDVPILGSIGRFDFIKGYDVMLHALAELLRDWGDGPAPVLVLAGDGPEEDSLRRLAETLGLGGAVHFLGWRQDPEGLLPAFTVFTLASRSEGTSVSLLEALSAGVCPVVTDVGGTRAVLGDVLRDRLVPPQAPQALARAWKQALTEPGRRRRDGELGRSRVLQQFSLEAMVRGYEPLYLDSPTGSAANV